MRILYDGQVYTLQIKGGVSRYFANLIARLPANASPSLLVEQTAELTYPTHPNLKVYQVGKSALEPLSYRLALFSVKIERYLLRENLGWNRFDILHPTYYSMLSGQSITSYRIPVVLTVWDMIHELFPATMDPTGTHTAEKKRAILAAQKIICISENTKRDLLERYAIPESKVAVTYLASEIDASLSYGPEPVSSRPYYLYVGSRESYKNFNGLLAAFARTVLVRPELALCVVGSPFSDEEEKAITRLNLAEHIEHYGYASDPHLAKLYRCSLALVYPSLYEGFGIPPLEAMSCGTVAVVSSCSSLPEVVGDSGVLFDPRSTDELFDILLSLMDDQSRREALVTKGKQRAKEFSWDRMAAQTVDIYRSLCE